MVRYLYLSFTTGTVIQVRSAAAGFHSTPGSLCHQHLYDCIE